MKLQKRFNRKVGDKEYSKYIITLPREQVEKLRWHEGEDLDSKIEQNKLIVELHKHK